MSGIRITIDQDNTGNYVYNCESTRPFEDIKPSLFNVALDIIQSERAKVIGKVDEKFYDKEYFEGRSEKSGLVDYDNQSKAYALEHAKERVQKLIFKTISPETVKDHRIKILEIGCAFGHTVDALRGLGYEAYGVDISEYAINKHKQNYKSVKDWTKGLQETDMPIPYVNMIYGFNLMEHIPELDLRRFIFNCHYNLSESGILFFTIDPVWGGDQSHCTIHSRDWWDDLFTESGFEIHKEGTELFKAINGHVYRRT